MKNMLLFSKKHLPTVLTLLATIITAVVVNCISNISFLENFIIAAVIALNLTFLFDFTRNLDDIETKVDSFNHLLPTSRIESFETVDQVADQLMSMVSHGKHNVDVVLYDIMIRTTDPKKVNKMSDFLRTCSDSKRIKLRLAFVPAPDSICQRIENFIEAEKKQANSYFAYQDSKTTFASFMIIDNSYVSIRTPHKNGSKSLYCVVKEETLCTLYSAWFDILWDEATHLETATLFEFLMKYKNLIPEKNYESYKKTAEEYIT